MHPFAAINWQPALTVLSYALAVFLFLALAALAYSVRPLVRALAQWARTRASTDAHRAAIDKAEHFGTWVAGGLEQTAAARMRALHVSGKIAPDDAAKLAADFGRQMKELMGPEGLRAFNEATGTASVDSALDALREAKVQELKAAKGSTMVATATGGKEPTAEVRTGPADGGGA